MEAERGGPVALVIGTGVVGRATGALLSASGFQVVGYDTNPEALALFPGARLGGQERGLSVDLIAVCAPTPTVDGQLDASAVRDAILWAGDHVKLSPRTIVAIRSTLTPGMTSALAGLLPGAHAGPAVCYWPSFARERLAADDELDPRLMLFGTAGDHSTRERLETWFGGRGTELRFCSILEAEFTKQAANAFNALKITYFNALGAVVSGHGGDGATVAANVASAAEGAWNPRYGTVPGAPFGGACLPKDLNALLGSLPDSGLRQLLAQVQAINCSLFETRQPG